MYLPAETALTQHTARLEAASAHAELVRRARERQAVAPRRIGQLFAVLGGRIRRVQLRPAVRGW